MKIHKSVRNLAIKHKLNIIRDHHGYYKIGPFVSMFTTAKSGIVTIRKYLKIINRCKQTVIDIEKAHKDAANSKLVFKRVCV